MSETLNDIIDRLSKQNEALNSRVAFFEASIFKQKQLLDSEIKKFSVEVDTIKKANIKYDHDLCGEVKELKSSLESQGRINSKSNSDLSAQIKEFKSSLDNQSVINKEFKSSLESQGLINSKSNSALNTQVKELKSSLDAQIKELKHLLESKKPLLINALTDKDVNSLIDARVTESYITNKYRNK
jgi:hypothetical protein